MGRSVFLLCFVYFFRLYFVIYKLTLMESETTAGFPNDYIPLLEPVKI